MKIEIDVVDDKLQNLSLTAKSELQKVIKVHIEEVLDEASRIEEGRRTSNHNPEITAAIINDAVYYAKSFGIRKRKTKRRVTLQIVAFLSSTITGGLFDVDKFNGIIYVGLFLLVFLFSIVSSVYLIFNDNAND